MQRREYEKGLGQVRARVCRRDAGERRGLHRVRGFDAAPPRRKGAPGPDERACQLLASGPARLCPYDAPSDKATVPLPVQQVAATVPLQVAATVPLQVAATAPLPVLAATSSVVCIAQRSLTAEAPKPFGRAGVWVWPRTGAGSERILRFKDHRCQRRASSPGWAAEAPPVRRGLAEEVMSA